jgi:acyl-coenzyme A thioesterase PaaI-like protein
MEIISLHKKFSRWPGGIWLFSRVASFKAPYFRSISPYVKELTSSKCVIWMRKKRAVTNHLGTIHAIAMCNMCEFSFGLMMEAGLPRQLRWIPKGMTVRYLKPAKTNLTAICDFPQILNLTPGDHVIPVVVRDLNDVIVMEADITVYVSQRNKV